MISVERKKSMIDFKAYKGLQLKGIKRIGIKSSNGLSFKDDFKDSVSRMKRLGKRDSSSGR